MNRCIFIAILFVCACETVVDVNLPDVGTPLVVNSIINPDSSLGVELSSAIAFETVTAREIYPPVTEAEITIWEDGIQLPIAFNHTSRGDFVSDYVPQPDKTYRMQVASAGFDTVEGEAVMPPAAQIAEVAIEQDDLQYSYGLDFRVSIQDDPDQNNFYSLWTLYTVITFDPETGDSLESYAFPIDMYTNDLVLANLDVFDDSIDEGIYFREAFFPDDLFQGRTYELDFTIQGLSVDFDGSGQIKTELQVHVLSVSEDLYRYKRASKLQRDIGDDPFSEPVEIPSNMSNGVGIFAGYQAEVINVSPDSILVIDPLFR